MTLKTRLVTTISMFCLVVALLITGVWAVSTANVNISGTISFNATNIYATITGKVEGATTTPTLSSLNYSANSTPTTTELNTWCQDLTFADATTPTIKWTVTIQNKSERALYVTLIDNEGIYSGQNKILTFDGGSAEGEQTIPAKTTKIYTIEFQITETNYSTTVDYDFNFVLRDSSLTGYDVTIDVTLVDGSSLLDLFGWYNLNYWINASNDGGFITDTQVQLENIFNIQFGVSEILFFGGNGTGYLIISSSTNEFSETINFEGLEYGNSSIFTITKDTIIYLEFYEGTNEGN